MNMYKTITITSKGQTTIPASIRRQLGLAESGGKLQASFNDQTGQFIITKQVGIEDLSSRISSFIKPGTIPVGDVDAYYQANREAKS